MKKGNKLIEITNKFPPNIKIAEEMLKLQQKTDVKIEEDSNSKTSLYVVASNKIIIGNMQDNDIRIQTIAHEVLHSCQNKKMLYANFIFSNIMIVYFSISVLLTIMHIIKNTKIPAIILGIIVLIWFIIRAILEFDAMTNARHLVKKYIEFEKICTKDEETEILEYYKKINKKAIPLYLCSLFITAMCRVIVYLIIGLVF